MIFLPFFAFLIFLFCIKLYASLNILVFHTRLGSFHKINVFCFCFVFSFNIGSSFLSCKSAIFHYCYFSFFSKDANFISKSRYYSYLEERIPNSQSDFFPFSETLALTYMPPASPLPNNLIYYICPDSFCKENLGIC